MRICIAIILLVSALSWTLNAQHVFIGSSVHVGRESSIHFSQSVRNEGYLENNGTLSVVGDWTNHGVYNGTGKLQLTGSATQRLSSRDQPIEVLELTGGGTKVFDDHISIAKNLVLQNGIIAFDGVGRLHLLSQATITGGSMESYVDGPLTYDGTGYKFFPIGKRDMYRPFELLDVTGIAPSITMELMEGMPEDMHVDVYENICRRFYWRRETIAGQFFASPVSAMYDDDDVAAFKNVVLIQSDNIHGTFLPLTTTGITGHERQANTITANAGSGNVFVLASQVIPEVFDPKQYNSTTLSPNAANPENRYIKVFGDFLSDESFRFVVFNRQGLVVFETTSLQEMKAPGWNGVAKNGSVLASGTYPYILKGISVKNEIVNQKGMITVIR